MKTPLRITFKSMPHSDALEAKIRQKAAKLERLHGHITGCRVLVDSPHRHQGKGKLYNVRIEISVPGGELVVNRDPAQNSAHASAFIAVRDAFDAAARRLEDHTHRQPGRVKSPGARRTLRATPMALRT